MEPSRITAPVTQGFGVALEETFPEKNKKTGVLYAVTKEGVELPVIDITNKAFAVHVKETELTTLYDQTIRQQMTLEGFHHSLLGRGILEGARSFLAGMNTYLLKLGADNLGSFAGPTDRLIAQTVSAISLRLRLQDMARLLSEGLIPILQAKPEQPLHLLNIAGGPAMDSLNALILIPKQYLAGRKIMIHVLDRDTAGPLFGQRALASLLSGGAPLAGLDIQFEHIPYNWAETSELQTLIKHLSPSTNILVASSEGGLFEYGSDAEIISNLSALSAKVSFVIGSVFRGTCLRETPFSAKPRTLEEFKTLAQQGGWSVEQSIERPLGFDVSLKK